MSETTTRGVTHASLEALEAGLADILASPRDGGVLRLIVRRPAEGEREVLQEAELDAEAGLVGDSWRARGSSRTPDGSAHPEMQLTLINARVIQRVARSPERWALAGDQLYLDLDLSAESCPPGTRLALGTAVIEITAVPHTGCRKFVERFGVEAMRWVSSPLGRRLNLRGINARVVRSGTVRVGNVATRLRG